MNYIAIINSEYFKQTYSEIEELKKEFPVNHGFIHVFNVIENAKKIADVFNLDERQKELLLTASVLHDIGYLQGRDNHALNGSIMAEKYLLELGFNKEDTSIICNAIKNHGGKKEENYRDVISMCLIIADKLDFIGKRYDKDRIKQEYLNIFPCILETNLEYKNNEIILNIKTNKSFDKKSFNNSNYFEKLNKFLSILSDRLEAKYNIKYEIENKKSL